MVNIMSGRQLEQIYWRISVFFLVLSTWIIFSVTKNPLIFSWNRIGFYLPVMTSVPLTLVITSAISLLRGGQLKSQFWLVKPTAHSESSIRESDQDACIRAVGDRIHALGFEVTLWGEPGEVQSLTFRKEKKPQIQSFLDHPFWGTIHVRPTGPTMELTGEVTFGDTVLIETGETTKLQALCDYMCLQSTAFTYENVPLTLYCALNIAFVSSIVLVLRSFSFYPDSGLAFSISAASIAMVLIVLVQMMNDRKHVFGYRLAGAGLYLASLPYLSLAFRHL